ncbi:hypothetical protein [Hespellia stercorisuis]|uniref:hypothetical protein n=1 Tax=Hespellia stercorisuis TaxID=180311 RepID=UPI001160CC66|nr:hypothetical protein [Hespellia stercorisuis]
MINTSTEFKQALERNSTCVEKASLLLKDGTLLEVDTSHVSEGGLKIDDGVTTSRKFDIGAAITNKLTLNLNNRYDEFSDYDFTNAVVTVWVGKQLNDRVEWLKKGVFNTDDPTATPSILTLECLDNMSKFDTTYDGGLSFPASLRTIVQYSCVQCGVQLYYSKFPNYTYSIEHNPFGEGGITYRAIIGYCALIAGCYARCNADGNLEFKWYDTAAFDGLIDGGVFDKTSADNYQTGVELVGGDFTNYSIGGTADGGTFTDRLPYHHIYSLSGLSVNTDDVVITGIRVKASDSQDSSGQKNDGETYLCGSEGYILEVSRNPLIEAGKAKQVAEYLAGRIVGTRFRPFTASAIGDPSWEAGDAAIITDHKGNSYCTYLTNLTYSTGGYASINCDAEPAARHSADRYAELNGIVADIKKDSQQKLDAYSQYVNQMNQLAINAMGYYETNETQSDGSIINYMHDKPLMSESTIIYKKSIDGFLISRDGGKTYVGGMDKDANIVANVIAAIGISFDWAKGGTLTLGGTNNGNGVLRVLNALNVQILRADKDGLNVTDGTIKGSRIVGSDISGAKIHNTNNTLIILDDGSIDSIEDVPWSGNYTMTNTCRLGSSELNFYTILKNGSWQSWTNVGKIQPMYPSNVDNGDLRIGGIGHISLGKIVQSNVTTRLGIDLVSGEVKVYGTFATTGSKSRIADTKNFGKRTLYCYETPTPFFGDIGTGITGEDGLCYVAIDDIFSETINVGVEYSVFLQKEGPGDIWVHAKDALFFVVKGTPNLAFSWEIKAVQKGYEYHRIEDAELEKSEEKYEYDDIQTLLDRELEDYDLEMEEMEVIESENIESISGD